MELRAMKIGLIGAGRMGETLIRGMLRKNLVPPQNFWISDKVEEILGLLRNVTLTRSQLRRPFCDELAVGVYDGGRSEILVQRFHCRELPFREL